jgi:hypothetical protein
MIRPSAVTACCSLTDRLTPPISTTGGWVAVGGGGGGAAGAGGGGTAYPVRAEPAGGPTGAQIAFQTCPTIDPTA